MMNCPVCCSYITHTTPVPTLLYSDSNHSGQFLSLPWYLSALSCLMPEAFLMSTSCRKGMLKLSKC